MADFATLTLNNQTGLKNLAQYTTNAHLPKYQVSSLNEKCE